MREDLGCSSNHQHALAEASKHKIMTLAVITLPAHTFSESLLPRGDPLVRNVDPMLLESRQEIYERKRLGILLYEYQKKYIFPFFQNLVGVYEHTWDAPATL